MSYEYETIADIIRLSEENNISFGDVVMRSELEQYDRSEKEIVKEIKHRLSIFEASIHDGMRHLQRTQSNISHEYLSGIKIVPQETYRRTCKSQCDTS